MTAEHEAIRLIAKDGFDAVLKPAGFARVGRTHTWTRRTPELIHIVTILHRRSQYDIQWGVFSPEAVEVLWGQPADPTDVGQSVMSGTPGTIRHPARGQSWTLEWQDQGELQSLIHAIRDDLEVVQKHLRSFERRVDVRMHLLQNRDPMDNRDFLYSRQPATQASDGRHLGDRRSRQGGMLAHSGGGSRAVPISGLNLSPASRTSASRRQRTL
jgi:hypothetical protein